MAKGMLAVFNCRCDGHEGDDMGRQRRKNEAVGVRRDAEYRQLGLEFKVAWGELNCILSLMVSGKDEEVNKEWATAMMESV
jgi:hypothetical protein